MLFAQFHCFCYEAPFPAAVNFAQVSKYTVRSSVIVPDPTNVQGVKPLLGTGKLIYGALCLPRDK